MSEINDIKGLPEGVFPMNLRLIYQHQRKDSIPMVKYKMGTYKSDYFHGEINIKC